jgi:hypothetical protein
MLVTPRVKLMRFCTGCLAMRRAPLWQWALAAVVLAILSRVSIENGLWLHADLLGWIVALLPAVILGLFAVPAIRRAVLIGPAYGFVKSILPRVSRTEQEALDAGTSAGMPNCSRADPTGRNCSPSARPRSQRRRAGVSSTARWKSCCA